MARALTTGASRSAAESDVGGCSRRLEGLPLSNPLFLSVPVASQFPSPPVLFDRSYSEGKPVEPHFRALLPCSRQCRPAEDLPMYIQ